MSEESIKVAVLEQKIIDLANIVEKIDDVISKLGDVNVNITKMLAVHEERIEQCNRSDALIIKMIDDFKLENASEHKEVSDKLEDLSRIKWMTLGCGAVLAILVGALATLASGWWTPMGMLDSITIRQQQLAK